MTVQCIQNSYGNADSILIGFFESEKITSGRSRISQTGGDNTWGGGGGRENAKLLFCPFSQKLYENEEFLGEKGRPPPPTVSATVSETGLYWNKTSNVYWTIWCLPKKSHKVICCNTMCVLSLYFTGGGGAADFQRHYIFMSVPSACPNFIKQIQCATAIFRIKIPPQKRPLLDNFVFNYDYKLYIYQSVLWNPLGKIKIR